MQENHLFEYAVIRVVPRVEREEFVNVGVILYCPSKGFLHSLFELNEERLKCFFGELDIAELKDYLHAMKLICLGGADGGTIGELPVSARFRWLTATRSTVVQTSMVHLGFCTDPQQKLEKLFEQLVL